MPLGISYYTFSAVGYIIDVRRGDYAAERDFLSYALFMAFFPKLAAGPIVRAGDFLPQARDYCGLSMANFSQGVQIFVFGLFKKIVLADRLGVFVDDVFHAPTAFSTGTVALAVVSYSLQIYFDFSGYSDMVVGIARILGFEFPDNFNLPYVSAGLSEFWGRWHVSLSSWLRDYVYIPLGGNRRGPVRTYANLILVMLASGLWHGAGWTFIAWGFLHGVLCCAERAAMGLGGRKKGFGIIENAPLKTVRVILTFAAVTLLWVLFRATDFSNALAVYKGLFTIHGGISQPYTWSFFAILCLVFATAAAYRNRREMRVKGLYAVRGYCPILDLRKFWQLTAFLTFCGLTVMLGYFGDTAFIYGKF